MSSQLIKFLASAAVLVVIALFFGATAALLQRGQTDDWAKILIGVLPFPLSFFGYQAACSTPFGRKYLYNWLGGPSGT